MFVRKVARSGTKYKSVAVVPSNAPFLAIVIVPRVVSHHGWSDVEVMNLCVARFTRVGGERNFWNQGLKNVLNIKHLDHWSPN